jgi:hypothetical protein
MRKIIVILLTFAVCVGCGRFEAKRLQGVAVECNGEFLTVVEMQRLTSGMSPEDSARVAEQYVRQWAINVLMQDAIRKSSNKDIERLVSDYRRSLYQHEWERSLVAQKMPQHVEDSLVQQYY